jgi:uncharacterized protein (TIGR03382 family)
VTVTAKDAAGNTASCSFDVTVRDSTAPVLTCPAHQVLEATSAQGATASFSATAVDAVTASPEVTYSHASGSTFPVGETAVSVTAKDSAGNASSCSFTVTVRDTTAPSLSCPEDLEVVSPNASGLLAVEYPAATASDGVSAVTVTYSQASGSDFPVGTTPVVASAKDAAGNSATCSFRVTVIPTVTAVESGGSGCGATGNSPAGMLGALVLLAWSALGRARSRRV